MASTSDTASSEGRSPSPSFDRQPTPDPQLVQTYHDLMLSTLPQDALPQPTLVAQEASNPLAGDEADEQDDMVVTETGEKRPMTKGEKQNAKKKRRKEREKAMKMEIGRQMAEAQAAQQGDAGKVEVREEKLVDFRLFSTCNVKPVSLLPAPEVYPIPANPRYQPLPAHQQARIHQLAVEAAVDSDNLGGHPDHPRWSRTDVTPRDFSVSHQALPTLPDMFIGTLSEDAVRTDQPSKPVAKSKSTAKSISTIPLASSHTSCPAPTLPPVSKKRTRRGRRAIPSRTAPHFWAPPIGLGGKARGYAWGFRDSREGRREEGWATYIRGTTV